MCVDVRGARTLARFVLRSGGRSVVLAQRDRFETRRLRMRGTLGRTWLARLAACGVALWACPSAGHAQAELGVDVDDMAANPSAYVGAEVVVRGEVVQILGPSTFALADPSAGGDRMIVAGAHFPDELDLRPGDRVVVTGQVGPPVGSADEPIVELSADAAERFAGHPVLWAAAVAVTGR
jgi:hypothetical protein